MIVCAVLNCFQIANRASSKDGFSDFSLYFIWQYPPINTTDMKISLVKFSYDGFFPLENNPKNLDLLKNESRFFSDCFRRKKPCLITIEIGSFKGYLS